MPMVTDTPPAPHRPRPRARRLAPVLGLMAALPALTGTIGPTDRLEERLLAAHNRERAAMGVPALRWSPALASDAQRWGRHLARLGQLRHYVEAPGDADPQGENLWAGTRGHYGPEAMVGLWLAEKRHFRPGVFPANSTTGRLDDVGHYTQLVWRSSGELGCAVVTGAEDDFLVCRYAEGGNVIGERPF